MRSRRSRLEIALRICAFGVIGWMFGQSLRPNAGVRVERASGANVSTHLPSWTRQPSNVTLHAQLDAAPDAWIVDWLAALRHSGHVVTWSGSPPAIAVAADAVAGPVASVHVAVAGPDGAVIHLRDDAGPLDSIRISTMGATVTTPGISGDLIATSGVQRATIRSPDTAHTRAVVVIGSAGWEGKFIATALEERGWPVIARFVVAPGVAVSQGAPLPLDTSRVAAVIAVDTAVQSLASSLDAYVRSGGGLVIAGPASLSPALATLRAGTSSARFTPTALPGDTVGLGATGFYPVASLAPGSIPLERRGPNGGIAVAARRIGAGRVIQVGYDDSWRWRMTGGPPAEAAHRVWWSRVVASVAYAPAPRPRADEGAAPVANLVARLGPARPERPVSLASRAVDQRILMAIALVLLLGEWASRRLRGLR